jgi:hypothetical protein
MADLPARPGGMSDGDLDHHDDVSRLRKFASSACPLGTSRRSGESADAGSGIVSVQMTIGTGAILVTQRELEPAELCNRSHKRPIARLCIAPLKIRFGAGSASEQWGGMQMTEHNCELCGKLTTSREFFRDGSGRQRWMHPTCMIKRAEEKIARGASSEKDRTSMTEDRDQIANAHQFFLSMLQREGYTPEECEAISRGMTVTSFRGEMPSNKTQRDKLIASWLEAGRMQ